MLPGPAFFTFMRFSNALGKIWVRWISPRFVGFMGVRWIIARHKYCFHFSMPQLPWVIVQFQGNHSICQAIVCLVYIIQVITQFVLISSYFSFQAHSFENIEKASCWFKLRNQPRALFQQGHSRIRLRRAVHRLLRYAVLGFVSFGWV